MNQCLTKMNLRLGELTGDIKLTDAVWQRGLVFRHALHPMAYLDVMTLDSEYLLVTTLLVPLELRRKGLATDLLKAIQTLKKHTILSADPSVDIYNSVSMEALHKLYTSVGFTQMDDLTSYQWIPKNP